MEKTIFLPAFILLFFFGLHQGFYQGYAQVEAPDHRWSVGVKGGQSLSFITRTNRQYSSERPNITGNLVPGHTGGLSIQYFAESHFALQVEAFLTQKGWEQHFEDTLKDKITDSLFYEVTLNYIEVPITAHGYIGKKNTRIFLEGGIYLAYLLSFDTRREQSITNEQITYTMRMREANQLDIGIRGGGGFEVATKAGTFQLGASYSYGLGSVLKRNLTNIPNMLQNQTITVTLGYFVEFGN